MNTPKHEKSIKELFRGKCWSYLNDNFPKFTTDNKIKIALALVCKDLDKDIGNGQETKIIIIRDSEVKKEIDITPGALNVGREISFNS